jgi:hypothetical protein
MSQDMRMGVDDSPVMGSPAKMPTRTQEMKIMAKTFMMPRHERDAPERVFRESISRLSGPLLRTGFPGSLHTL